MVDSERIGGEMTEKQALKLSNDDSQTNNTNKTRSKIIFINFCLIENNLSLCNSKVYEKIKSLVILG